MQIFITSTVLLLLSAFHLSSQCPCYNGGTCYNEACSCSAGWTGKNCHRPCVDYYKSCKNWDEERRCEWTVGLTTFFLDNCPVTCRQCTFNAETVPKGLPLPPILEPLAGLVGVWETETSQPDKFPVRFSGGGYKETLEFLVAEVPGFDTPSLNYTCIAISTNDPTDVQTDVGFVWMRPQKNNIKQVGNMMTTNSGVTVVQEGVLEGDTIRFNSTTYSQVLPNARNGYLDVDVSRTVQFQGNTLTQVVSDSRQNTYTKVYRRVIQN